MSNLIVLDANARKYRPNGQFREPRQGEYVWCTGHQRVEQCRPDIWCFVDPPWRQHRIIVEPLPEPKYEVTIRLAQADIDQLEQMRDTDAILPRLGARVGSEVMEGNYREVTS